MDLEAWSAVVLSWAGEPAHGPPWVLVAGHGEGDALPVVARPGRASVQVELDAWSYEFSTDDGELHEALELVACALFGRVRLVQQWHRGTLLSWSLEFRGERGWIEHHRQRVRWHLPWQGHSRILVNDRAAPRPLTSPGRLPSSPWVGVLPDDDADRRVEVPLDGELDLHTYSPRQVGKVVRAYVEACHEQGTTELRIVHGKGVGNLRRTVHAELDRSPHVEAYRLGTVGEGSWGATIVTLRGRS